MEYLYIHEISISFIDGLEYIYIYVYKGNEACTVVLQLTGITEARRRGEARRSEGRSRVHYGVLIRKIASSFSVLSSRIPAASGGERERKEWGKARANTRIGRRGSDPFLKIYVKQDGAFPPPRVYSLRWPRAVFSPYSIWIPCPCWKGKRDGKRTVQVSRAPPVKKGNLFKRDSSVRWTSETLSIGRINLNAGE